MTNLRMLHNLYIQVIAQLNPVTIIDESHNFDGKEARWDKDKHKSTFAPILQRLYIYIFNIRYRAFLNYERSRRNILNTIFMYENGYKKDCKVQPMQTLRTCKVSKLCKNQSF